MRIHIRSVVAVLLSFSAVLGLTTPVYAAGYAILENSAEGMGSAFAGGVVGYGDGSSAFLNPAAMTSLDATTMSFSGHLILPQADFNDSGSTVAGMPNIGTDGLDGGAAVFVPNVYMVHPLTEDMSIGLNVNAPFGLKSDFNDKWVGRYQADRSELEVVNIGGSLGIDIDQHFSVGFGLSGVYADAELSNAIDFGTIGVSTLGPETAAELGLLPQASDGHAVVQGDDWGFGWNVGSMFRFGPNGQNRIGASYKAKTSLDLRGTGTFTVPTAATILTSSGSFANTGAMAGVTLPESFTFGGKYWLNSQWAVLYESQWTRWSRLDELRVEFDNPAQPDSVTDTSWNNVWRHSFGFAYLPASAWELRAGFTYDESPIPDAAHRTPRIPDADRYWLAGGLSYHINDQVQLDLAYAHLFVDDGDVATAGTTDSLQGSFDSSVDLISAGFVVHL